MATKKEVTCIPLVGQRYVYTDKETGKVAMDWGRQVIEVREWGGETFIVYGDYIVETGDPVTEIRVSSLKGWVKACKGQGANLYKLELVR